MQKTPGIRRDSSHGLPRFLPRSFAPSPSGRFSRRSQAASTPGALGFAAGHSENSAGHHKRNRTRRAAVLWAGSSTARGNCPHGNDPRGCLILRLVQQARPAHGRPYPKKKLRRRAFARSWFRSRPTGGQKVLDTYGGALDCNTRGTGPSSWRGTRGAPDATDQGTEQCYTTVYLGARACPVSSGPPRDPQRRLGTSAYKVMAAGQNSRSKETSSWTDYSVTVPDPKGRTFYYRMRGEVYSGYSDYTQAKQPAVYEEGMSP